MLKQMLSEMLENLDTELSQLNHYIENKKPTSKGYYNFHNVSI